MKKTQITFLLTALILSAVITGLILTGCSSPMIVPSGKTQETVSEDANNQAMVGVTKANKDGTYSLEFALPKKNVTQASRMLVNYDDSTALQLDINWYQLVLVHTEKLDEIWASVTAQSSGVLNVVVKPLETYHFLLLHGHKKNPADASEAPTLLGSGYLKYKIQEKDAAMIIIRMVPMLVDATISNATTPFTPWSMTRNIAWVKNESFDVAIELRSRSANQATATPPHGNALWPLLLAQAARTETETPVWDTFKEDMPAAITDRDSPQYKSSSNEGAPWEGLYWTYDGENTPIDMPNTLNLQGSNHPETGLVAAYYSVGTTDNEVDSKPLVDSATTETESGAVTTGSLKYSGFPSLTTFSQPMTYGKFSFALTYIPFGITDVSTWSDAGFGAAPRWKIGGEVYLYREADVARIESFDLYNANYEKLSLFTVITHTNDQNNDPNLITIVVPLGTPRITTGFTQIRLESADNMEVSPPSGTLPANFEPNDPVPEQDSLLNVTYKVYPKGQTAASSSARTYTVVLKRSDTSQGQPNPDAPLTLSLTPNTSALKGTVSVGTPAGVFSVSGTASAVGTPVYTLEADTGMTNGVANDRDNGKFTITGTGPNLVVDAELSPGDYYIVAKVDMMDGGNPLATVKQAFKIVVSQTTSPGHGWGN